MSLKRLSEMLVGMHIIHSDTEENDSITVLENGDIYIECTNELFVVALEKTMRQIMIGITTKSYSKELELRPTPEKFKHFIKNLKNADYAAMFSELLNLHIKNEVIASLESWDMRKEDERLLINGIYAEKNPGRYFFELNHALSPGKQNASIAEIHQAISSSDAAAGESAHLATQEIKNIMAISIKRIQDYFKTVQPNEDNVQKLQKEKFRDALLSAYTFLSPNRPNPATSTASLLLRQEVTRNLQSLGR